MIAMLLLQRYYIGIGHGRVNLYVLLLGLLLLGAGLSGVFGQMGKYDRQSRLETNVSSWLALLAGIAILGYCVYAWIPFAQRP